MLAHLHLALARTAPKVIVPHTSTSSQSRMRGSAERGRPEYDRIAPGSKTKDHHYTEAAANLNRADQALQSSGQFEEEPVALSMGKSMFTG
jgi:RNA polymerase-associated protein CTR9